MLDDPETVHDLRFLDVIWPPPRGFTTVHHPGHAEGSTPTALLLVGEARLSLSVLPSEAVGIVGSLDLSQVIELRWTLDSGEVQNGRVLSVGATDFLIE